METLTLKHFESQNHSSQVGTPYEDLFWVWERIKISDDQSKIRFRFIKEEEFTNYEVTTDSLTISTIIPTVTLKP